MNKLIRDLALEAIVENISTPAWVFSDNELELFAQLIVQECIQVISRAVDQREPASTYVNKLREHFHVLP